VCLESIFLLSLYGSYHFDSGIASRLQWRQYMVCLRKLTECIRETEDVDFPTVFKVIKGMDLIFTKREEGRTVLQESIKGHQKRL